MEPLVTIVTPSYNQAEFIERTILSVRNQDYPNIEHIVIDGGSTDNTLHILKRYEDRLRWRSEPDQGQSDAINKGFLLATGRIVAWLNSDDTYEPNAVRRVVDFLSEHPHVAMVYGDCQFIDENDEVIGHWVDSLDFDLDLLTNKALNFIPQAAVFFRREVLDTVGLLDVNLHMAMDYDFWIRVGRRSKVKRMPKVLANFRFSSNSKSVANWSAFWPEVLSILTKHCGAKPLPWFFRRYYRAAREHSYDPLRAFSMLERAILKDRWLAPYRMAIRATGLSQAFVESAHEDYLLNRRHCGLRNLLLSLKTDFSLIGSKEFHRLGAKLVLGRPTIGALKGAFHAKMGSLEDDVSKRSSLYTQPW